MFFDKNVCDEISDNMVTNIKNNYINKEAVKDDEIKDELKTTGLS